MPWLWLAGCTHTELSPDAAYRAADSAFRAADAKLALCRARNGSRLWPTGDWGWKFRLLTVESLNSLHRFREARAALETYGKPDSNGLRARWLRDEALSGVPPEKRAALFNEALPLAIAAGDPVSATRIESGLVSLARDEASAMDHAQAETAAAVKTHDPYFLAMAQLDEGLARMNFSKWDDAIPFFEESLANARRCGAQNFIANAMGDLGTCYFRLGDSERALKSLVPAEEMSRATGGSPSTWLNNIGVVYYNINQDDDAATFDRALDYLRRAEQVARESSNNSGLAMALNNQTLNLIGKGDLAGARRANDDALAINRGAGDQRALVYSELNAAQIEALSGERDQGERDFLQVIEKARKVGQFDVVWEGCGRLAALYRAEQRPELAEKQYAEAIATIDREWDKLIRDESKVTFLAPGIVRMFKDYVDFLVDQHQDAKAAEMAESARARLLRERLQKQSQVSTAFSLNRLLYATKASHTVILTYWLAPKRSFVWVLAAGRLERRELPPSGVISKLVGKYLEAIKNGGDPLARNDTVAGDLYKAVLAPVQSLIPGGSDVIVVPDGALYQLDFETLVAPDPQPHYWIEDAYVSTAPSLRVLATHARTGGLAPRLLVIGDPVPTSDFPRLPHAGDEIAIVQKYFPAASRIVWTGPDATPGRYAEAGPGKFSTIHFAAHASADKERPLRSSIILSRQLSSLGTDFRLYASDVAGWPLRADLVTISACNSAGGQTYSGEGLVGFAWAFLQAGAWNVIASLWDVDDATSVQIMDRMYAAIAAGQPPARALREAKRAVMASGRRHRAPYFWAALQVYTRRL